MLHQFSRKTVSYRTNDQSLHDETRDFIYSGYVCVTAQHTSFNQVETTLKEAKGELTHRYKINGMRTNPNKTQVIGHGTKKPNNIWNSE